jgi:hypothetical protein
MMKAFGYSIVAISFLVFVGSVDADNPTCADGDSYCVDTNDGDAGNGNPLVDVTKTLPKPAQGIFAIGPSDNDPMKLYVFYDADEGTGPFSGYIGVSMKDIDKALGGGVGAIQGNFNRDGGNTPLIGILVTPGATALEPPTFPELPSVSNLAGPTYEMLTGMPNTAQPPQDAMPTTLTNALPQVLVLPSSVK